MDEMAEADVVEGPFKRITRDELVKAIRKIKPGKESGLSEVSMEMLEV